LISRLPLRASIALGLLLPPVVTLSADPRSAPPQPIPSSGEILFVAHCGICHLQMGPGTIMLGRRLGPDHALLDERLDLDAAYIKQVVRVGIGGMPPQTRVDLPDAELDSVAAYLTRPASERRPSRGLPHGNGP
jgi:mono/diheme cytochrome c family protein